MNALRAALPAGLFGLVLGVCLSAAEEPPSAIYGAVDTGAYRISVQGRPIGVEIFTFTIHYDSLYVNSEYLQPLRSADTLRKTQMLVVRHFDNDLIYYNSKLAVPGRQVVTRGITVGDTTLTSFIEGAEGGEGVTHVKPAGRLFVIESNAYALFDLLFRDLALRKGWDQRPVNVVAIGERDTVILATARSLGADTLRWGNGPVTARKYSLSDGHTVFYAWVGPTGWMLRLEQPAIELTVVRDPPPAKRSGRKTPPKS